MNKLFILSTIFLFTSCSNNDVSEKPVNKEFYFSPEKIEAEVSKLTPSGEYVNLQIKMHTAYRLLKALNDGVISQVEYDKLKEELI
jgi:hypothetical protein|tara:strand:+ start:1370 stop:1627 length:258 start_codon:yes stop_codon:yes gene_type:complete